MEVSHNTIVEAEKRLEANNGSLEVTMADIAHQEDLRDTAQADQDQAQEDLDEETARWAGVQASYEAYMAELQHELGALDQCIGVFASFDMSDDMLARVDWW